MGDTNETVDCVINQNQVVEVVEVDKEKDEEEEQQSKDGETQDESKK
jgi:hypothetical protein